MVQAALSAPLLLISENAGHEGQVILEGVRNGEGDYGFDADRGEFCNLIEAGIIDPVKVTRSALQNAGSVAGMMMTTQAIITEIPEFIPLLKTSKTSCTTKAQHNHGRGKSWARISHS